MFPMYSYCLAPFPVNNEMMEVYMCSTEAQIVNDGPGTARKEQGTKYDVVGRFLMTTGAFPLLSDVQIP